MNSSEGQVKQNQLAERILGFVEQASGLRSHRSGDVMEVSQSIDGKSLLIRVDDLDDVLLRSDGDGKDFIQINFCSGNKILITDTLIGFRPAPLGGLDMNKLPRVVTTPDVMSVFEAIQEALHLNDDDSEELLLLKRVFDSVVTGGEAVGFDLAHERAWIVRLHSLESKITV